MGKIYIANTVPALALYQVNWGAEFTGRPCSSGADLPPWTPRFVTASLQNDVKGSVFGYGDNAFSVTFQGLDPPDEGHSFTVTVPRSLSLDDPLLLYAFVGRFALMTYRGVPVPQTSTLVAGNPLG